MSALFIGGIDMELMNESRGAKESKFNFGRGRPQITISNQIVGVLKKDGLI